MIGERVLHQTRVTFVLGSVTVPKITAVPLALPVPGLAAATAYVTVVMVQH